MHTARCIRPWRIAAAALLSLALACGGGGGDGGTGPGPGPVTPQPTAIVAHAGNDQRVLAGSAVPVAPAVRVTDRNGTPMAGVVITFTVTAGGGTITGAQATTDASGVATLGGWTLGAAQGDNTLTATGPAGLAPVTFRAIATDVCGMRQAFTLGAGATGALAATDCRLDSGGFTDFYAATLPANASVRFTMTSSQVDALLTLVTADGVPVAANDDFADSVSTASFRVLAPAGSYVLGATSFDRGEVGAYAIASTSVPTDVARCEEVFIVPGVTTTQTVQSTDCPSAADATGARFYSDEFIVWLVAGRTYTIDLTSTAFDSFLVLFGPDNSIAAQNDNVTPSARDSRVVFTPTRSGFHLIDAGPVARGITGAYTLGIR